MGNDEIDPLAILGIGDLAPFHAWAGVAMEGDLAPKRSAAEPASVHAWTKMWTKRANALKPQEPTNWGTPERPVREILGAS
jgi:hypothetical protein